MTSQQLAADVRNVGPEPRPGVAAELLDVQQVSRLLGCSCAGVRRLCDRGQMPPSVRLGKLRRWRRADLFSWIARGCPATR